MHIQSISPSVTPPKFNCLPLKNDGWKMILSFWDGLFSGVFAVSFNECSPVSKIGDSKERLHHEQQ